MTNIINPLNIYVMWHPAFSEGEEYANSFFSHYNHDINDPLSRGIGIPVYYRTGDNPVDLDLSNANYNAIVILIDDEMIISDNWIIYINDLIEKVSKTNGNSMIFPIAVSQNAFKMQNNLPSKNYIRLYDEASINKIEYLLNSTTHEICRQLYDIDRIDHDTLTDVLTSSPPLKLFISHAKEDGVEIAKSLSDYIQTQTALKTFFDANDIAIGYEFTQEIEENIHDSVLLVVQSDKYSSREWCRREVLIAKRNNRPIVVVNLYNEGEDRSFPYMGNLKTIRFDKSLNQEKIYQKILLLTLKETLRFKYHQMFISYLTRKFNINEVSILSQPPELLSILNLVDKEKKLTIYPDPPLSEEELEIVTRGASDGMQFFTPTYIPLLGKKNEYGIHELSFLDSLNVGISISESQNIREYGFEHIHIQDTLVEFTRYLLASGVNLSYGGDVKYDKRFNFAQILFDLARHYQNEKIRPSDKITNYVPYPLYKQIPVDLKAKLNDVARFIEISPPDNLVGDDKKILKAETVKDLYVWSRSLTKMRETMNNHIDARILIGGKFTGFKGKIPGVVEEAYLALMSEKPVYLIGAMGGASKSIINCLIGNKPNEFTEQYQFRNQKYKEFYVEYNKIEEKQGREVISYEKIVKFFNEKGIAGLNNGLSDEENKKLFCTGNITEIISLVLKGLMSIK